MWSMDRWFFLLNYFDLDYFHIHKNIKIIVCQSLISIFILHVDWHYVEHTPKLESITISAKTIVLTLFPMGEVQVFIMINIPQALVC